mgnify:CR=1 FL=1
MTGLVHLKTCLNEIEAHIVKGALGAYGVAAVVRQGDGKSINNLSIQGDLIGFTILVEAAEVETAKEILQRLEDESKTTDRSKP